MRDESFLDDVSLDVHRDDLVAEGVEQLGGRGLARGQQLFREGQADEADLLAVHHAAADAVVQLLELGVQDQGGIHEDVRQLAETLLTTVCLLLQCNFINKRNVS